MSKFKSLSISYLGLRGWAKVKWQYRKGRYI